MNLDHYNEFYAFAKRVASNEADAEDILQNSLFVAYKEDRLDFSIEQHRKWLFGVLKNQAAMLARTEARRKNREGAYLAPSPQHDLPASVPDSVRDAFLKPFPPSARTVLVLILAGLNRQELCALLHLTPDSLRQRLRIIKKIMASKPLAKEALALSYNRRTNPDDLALGLIRRSVRRLLKEKKGIGTHDPDGHPIILNLK